MEIHNEYCEKRKQNIPVSLINLVRKDIPVFYIMTIGYSGHGKTCYLSSIFYFLYHFMAKKWKGFSFLSLTQETLDRIHRSYVSILEELRIPSKTPIMFPEPLIINTQKIPVKTKKNTYQQKEALFVFYDIGGGTFEFDKKIEENVPIISRINTLVFLIDLPGLLKDDKTKKNECDRKIHALMNVIYNSLEKLGQKSKKHLVISFTKADLMKDKEDVYGPLARWETDIYNDEFPEINELPFYLSEMKAFSSEIDTYFSINLPMSYNTMKNNFKSLSFTTFSSLGNNPVEAKLTSIEPKRIFDPIFFNMINDGNL
jgi:hypothetical protein